LLLVHRRPSGDPEGLRGEKGLHYPVTNGAVDAVREARVGKGVAAIFIVAMIAGFSAVADEPLPVVKTKSATQAEAAVGFSPGYDAVPMITDTPTEPVRPTDAQLGPATLALAVAANDYAAFERLYAQAVSRGEDLSAYRDIHELWSYAQSDRIGAFYTDELHDRLARRYPQYRSYIEDYRVLDSRGRAYYPTVETRSFLLQQALAEVKPLRPAETRVAAKGSAPLARRHRRMQLSSTSTKPTPPVHTKAAAVVAQRVVAQAKPPVVSVPAPIVAAVTPPVAQAPKPAVVLASAMTTPSAAAVADALKADMQKVAPQPPAAATSPAQSNVQAESPAPARGLFLIILGLIGIGILTIMLRTPGEKPMTLSLSGNSGAAPETKSAEPALPIQASQEPPPAEPIRIQSKQPGRRVSGSRG
jgi:hypothetical protein